MPPVIRRVVFSVFSILLVSSVLVAADQNFHNAPDTAKAEKNPYEGKPTTMAEGKRLYGRNCLSCHGITGHGKGNVPSLINDKVKSATEGEIFWFITKGSKDNGMPAWAFLPEQQRWEIVSYIKSLGS